MKTSGLQNLSAEEIVEGAIKRERTLLEYYREAITAVGPDADATIRQFYEYHHDRIILLEKLLRQIQELRELSVGMAD